MGQTSYPALGLGNRINEIIGSAEQVSRIQMTAEVLQVVRALAGYSHRRRRRQPTENFIPHKSCEDARLEFD